MPTLTVTLKTITPLFLGGAEPNDFAELRPPAIKGLLRFWYRAVDPNYRDKEGKIFGGTGATEGQSSFRLQLESPIRESMPWNPNRYRGAPFQKRSKGEPPKNGLLYLGFPLRLGGNDRKAIPPGTSFSVKIRFSTAPTDEEIRKAVLSSWWLLGHFGGLGTRSRRGFGTVALQRWEGGWPEAEALPIAHGEKDLKKWITKVENAVKTMRSWFGKFPDDKIGHTTIAKGTCLYLSTRGFEDDQRAKAWEWALWQLGMDMQTFRQKREPDYSAVKAHLVQCGRNGNPPLPVPRGVTLNFLSSSPQRAAFGLPLTFRYRSLSGFPSTTFRPALHERSASPILLRVVEIGGRAHPLVIRLRAPVPGSDGGVVEENRRHVVLPAPSDKILDKFCSYLKTEKGFEEVSL